MLNVSSSAHVENVLFEGNCVTENYGGGMYNLYAASPVVIHCEFNNNQAHMGGGYACDHGSPFFEDVTFSNNFTTSEGYGGGAYFHDYADVTLIDVTFIGNQSYTGGGIYSFRNGSITMTDVSFIQNTVLNSEISNDGGGLSVSSDINVYAENVSFIGNTAADCGGGVFITARSTFDLNNGLFLGNHAERNIGGGLGAQYTSTVTLTNTTFNGNRSVICGETPRGGSFWCIVWRI